MFVKAMPGGTAGPRNPLLSVMSRLDEQKAVGDASCIHVSTHNVPLGIDSENLRCAYSRCGVVDRKELSSGH